MSACTEIELTGPTLRFRGPRGGFELSLHWLRAHCRCPGCRTPGGQRLFARSAPLCLELRGASIVQESVLLEWGDGHRTTFELTELHRFAAWRDEPVPFGMSSRRPLSLARLPWSAVAEPEVHDWLKLLADNHVLLFEGAPTIAGQVSKFAGLIAPVQRTIYGESWLVTANGSNINIAYTSIELPLHQDLTAYESPPGLQLLHCLRYDDEVVGGESSFCDLLAAAESLRISSQEHFHTLCTVWATFAKVNALQHMVLRKPHIRVDDHGHIVEVSWAPPFEGPYAGPPALESAYNAAHAALDRAIASTARVRFRMRAGDLVVFNNRRTLHARDGFVPTLAPQGGRVLEGCYLGQDDVANRFLRGPGRAAEPPLRSAARRDEAAGGPPDVSAGAKVQT